MYSLGDDLGIKTQALKKSGLLNLHRSEKAFDSLGGLTALKSFTKRALLRSSSETQPPELAVFCSCHTRFAENRSFVNALQEVGRLFLPGLGSLMAHSSANRRSERAKLTNHRLPWAPCVVMIDEIEKAFAGAMGGSGDSAYRRACSARS